MTCEDEEATYCAWLVGREVPPTVTVNSLPCSRSRSPGEHARAVVAESMYSSSSSSPIQSKKSTGACRSAAIRRTSAAAPLFTPLRRTSTSPLAG